MRAARKRTLFDRLARAVPILNWEVHVLQSGLHTYTMRRPWLGVPAMALLLSIIWAAYWLVVPVLLVLCLIARIVRPIELRLRNAS